MSSLIHLGAIVIAALVALLVNLLVALVGDELRGWMQSIPPAVLRLAVHRVPKSMREKRVEQWRARLTAICKHTRSHDPTGNPPPSEHPN